MKTISDEVFIFTTVLSEYELISVSLSVHLPSTLFLPSLSVCACILCVSMRVCRVSNVGVCGNG